MRKPKASDKKSGNAKKTGGVKINVKAKNSRGAIQRASKKHSSKSVRKNIAIPVSSTTKTKAQTSLSSRKRLEVMNKRRPGLSVMSSQKGKNQNALHNRPQRMSAMRAANRIKSETRRANKGTLDTSNIERHFRTQPKKFNVPKGQNMRITVDLDKVKPIAGFKG